MRSVKLNAEELEVVVNHIFESNINAADKGRNPVALNIVGEAGVGKTSAIIDYCKRNNLECVKLNLSQLEEIGDLVGMPIKEYEFKTGGKKTIKKQVVEDGKAVFKDVVTDIPEEIVWINEHLYQEFLKKGQPTGKSRMNYAPPAWIVGKEDKKGILMLDDFSRAALRFIQAVMEILDRGEYMSWKLPENWSVILTSNPDDGSYFVTPMDKAQLTRMVNVDFKFDISVWAQWAEKSGIDGRCISFALLHPELLGKDCNARSMTTFFNSVTEIEDFAKNLPLVQVLGEGTVGVAFATTFTTFIHNNLDKMITPDRMLNSGEKEVDTELSELLGSGNTYRGDLASVLCQRFINHIDHKMENSGVTPDQTERIKFFLVGSEHFTMDLKYVLIKKLIGKHKVKFAKLLQDKAIFEMTLK